MLDDNAIVHHNTKTNAFPPKKPKMEPRDDVPPMNTFDIVSGQTITHMAIQSVWIDPFSTTECLTVAIVLPSGVGAKDFMLVRVLDGGRDLEISFFGQRNCAT